MRILFIYPDPVKFSGTFHYGLGYISSVLKGEGHSCDLLTIKKDVSERDMVNEVEKRRPDVVGFSSTTHQFPNVVKFSSWIKGAFDIPIISGGSHTTIDPSDVMSRESVDVACIGEGEYPMLDLISNLESGNDVREIKNLWVRGDDGRVHKNELRPLIKNLDELPFPDRSFDDLIEKTRIADMLAGRGCPYECSYCCNHVYKKIYENKGPYVRYRSVDNVLEEISLLIDKYGINRVNFHDDTFTLFRKWLEEFSVKYGREFDISFECNARADNLNEEIVRCLSKAHCDLIRIGIETGNEGLRKNVLHRNMSNQQIIDAFDLAHSRGIKTSSFNMLGIPGETTQTIEDTMVLNEKIDPTYVQASIFYPYPNTRIHEICEREGLLTDRSKGSYFDYGTTLNLKDLAEGEINRYYKRFRDWSFEKRLRDHPSLFRAHSVLKLLIGENRSIGALRILSRAGYSIKSLVSEGSLP